MKNKGLILIVMMIVAGIWLPAAGSEEAVEEPSTKKQFPRTVTFEHGGQAYTLSLTGVGVRKKVFFKVYGIAHYMDTADFKDMGEALEAAQSDRYAKQITLEFVRDVGAEDVRKAFRDGLDKNATTEEKEVIAPFTDRFIGYFKNDAGTDDQYVLRWLPDGIVLTMINGEVYAPIENVTFARVLWQIWLGEKSIVDRKKLVGLAVED